MLFAPLLLVATSKRPHQTAEMISIHVKSFVHLWRYVDIHKSFHHYILMLHLNREGTFNLEFAMQIFYVNAYAVYADIRISGEPHICGYAVYILIRIHYADRENICA